MAGKKNYSRASERLPVSPQEIRGSLVNHEGNADQVALVWNISVQGLCLWASRSYQQGEEVTLKVTVPWRGKISCLVRWVKPIPDKSGFLLGLETKDGNDALRGLHESLIKKVRKSG